MITDWLLDAVEVLQSGSEDEQVTIAEQLAAFTEDPLAADARMAVGVSGALTPLVALLASPASLVRLRSVQVILHLSRTKQFRYVALLFVWVALSLYFAAPLLL
jgi:hypothetical protein